ncbi:MAG: hypothetical protein IPP36_06515 [Nitrosomonadales bacterium]|nr:hypothetical protein [Nitrosomonadales bacterium]
MLKHPRLQGRTRNGKARAEQEAVLARAKAEAETARLKAEQETEKSERN